MTKYKDDLSNGYVNGHYVGIRQGAPTQDALQDEGSDGYENERNYVRFGTVTQDAANPNYPEPLEDEEETEIPDPEPDPEEGEE